MVRRAEAPDHVSGRGVGQDNHPVLTASLCAARRAAYIRRPILLRARSHRQQNRNVVEGMNVQVLRFRRLFRFGILEPIGGQPRIYRPCADVNFQ